MAQTNKDDETFGERLIDQMDSEGAIAELIAAAKADRAFPRRGSPNDVRKRLNKMQADDDMHAVFGDTNPDWLDG